MNIAHEFFRVRESFKKVKDDMNFISNKISENYDEFMQQHQKLASEVEMLSVEIKESIEKAKHIHITNADPNNQNEKDIHDLKAEIKLLKKDVILMQKEHTDFTSTIDKIKNNKKEIKEVKEKLHSSELELFLLKDKLSEKDIEIKQIKEISKHLFDVVDDLSKAELDLLNLTNNNGTHRI
jgi:prefoldin subunit 5